MKLFLISQTVNGGRDTFDSAVVAAEDEETARNMNPSNGESIDWRRYNRCDGWAFSAGHVMVKLLGTAAQEVTQGVLCSSYNSR